jgi:hypothetical protein
MDALRDRIVRELGWTVRTPGHQETIDLDAALEPAAAAPAS